LLSSFCGMFGLPIIHSWVFLATTIHPSFISLRIMKPLFPIPRSKLEI
jgi:hypothetical protein